MSDNIVNVPPNLASPVVERMTWLTDVLPGFDRYEQRVRLRQAQRRTFAYSFALLDFRMRQFQQKFIERMGSEMFMPDWTDPRKLLFDAPAGTGSVDLDDQDGIFFDRTVGPASIEGTWLIFWRDPNQYEVRRAFEADGSQIGLDMQLQKSWTISDTVYTLHRGFFARPLNLDRHTTTVVGGSLEFALQTETDIDWTWDVALDQHNGIDVWLDMPNRRETINQSWRRDFSTLDNETGVWRAFDHSGYQNIDQRMTWTLTDKAMLRRWRGLLQRRQGRLNPFYMPFWTNDFTVASDIPAGATQVDIVDIGYAESFNNTNAPAGFIVRNKTNSHYFADIIAATDIGGGIERLTLAGPAPFEIKQEDVKMASMLHYCRLNHDSVELSHIAPNITESQLTITTGKL